MIRRAYGTRGHLHKTFSDAVFCMRCKCGSSHILQPSHFLYTAEQWDKGNVVPTMCHAVDMQCEFFDVDDSRP